MTAPASKPTFRVETWGCQMNVLDGQRMAGQLEALGLSRAADGEVPSVVLLNTCAVREKAEAKVFSELGVLARRKQLDPDLVVGVTGCVAQVSGSEILERAPWVDFVAGTGQVESIGELVEAARRERRQALRLELPEEDPVYQFRQISRESSFQAYVTVIEGCDQYCTFCIVPFTRGSERSRAAAEVVEEVRHLASRGFTEVTLLGQTVNAYREPAEGFGLGELLRRVSRVEGLRRLRFLTSHPRFMDEELVDALGAIPNLAPYLHLPAQSGSDRVLSRMKRRYTTAEYRRLVDRIRDRAPGISISSDFIVGFPGETEEDFAGTLELVRAVRFGSLFGFRYSPRPGNRVGSMGERNRSGGGRRGGAADPAPRPPDRNSAGAQRGPRGARARGSPRGPQPPRAGDRSHPLQPRPPPRRGDRGPSGRTVRRGPGHPGIAELARRTAGGRVGKGRP